MDIQKSPYSKRVIYRVENYTKRPINYGQFEQNVQKILQKYSSLNFKNCDVLVY